MCSFLSKDDFCHIDPTVIDDLRQQMPGYPEIVNRVISSFLRSSPDLLNKLREALLAGDMEGVRRKAHSMKSSNAQIGAMHMAAICAKLEVLDSLEHIGDITKFLHDLDKEYQEVEGELGQLLALFRSDG